MNSSAEGTAKLLVVDDDDSFRTSIGAILALEGFTVDEAWDGEEAVRKAREQTYDLILLDMKMPGMDGIQVLKTLRADNTPTDFMMVTGHQDVNLATECIKLGAREYLLKPIEPAEIVQRVKSALRSHDAERRVKTLQIEFNARLLYELRSPISTLRSAVSFLTKESAGPLNDRQRDIVAHMEDNIQKTEALLSDMIDLTHLESGRVDLQKLPTNVDELVPAVCARIKPQAAAKHITIAISIKGTIPTIEVDPDKIEQVLTNLLQNAIKYSPEHASITVSVTHLDQTATALQRECVEVSVADTGVGLSVDELPHIFDKFKEFLTGKTSQQKTTGLGLAICRNIVVAHGGDMNVESTPGKGSRFSFLLPL